MVALEDRPEVAVEAWKEVRPRVVLDKLEAGSFELMPLIYRNLTLGGTDEPELPRLKGIYRKAWVSNTLLTERTKESAEVLAAADIAALFIEGVTLASRFYPELGLRPTAVIDIFVHNRDETVAVAQLARAGWTATESAATAAAAGVRYMSDRSGHVCLLRSRLVVDWVVPLLNSAQWHRTAGAEVRVLPPTETLFAVIVAHARTTSPPTIQWVVDAKMVLRAEIDWDRFVTLAGEGGQVLRVREALGYLAALPGSQPPPEIHDRLSALTVTRRERLSYVCTTGSIRWAGALPSLFAEHLGTSVGKSTLRTIATFPGFLRRRWSLAHWWQLPIAAGRRAVRLLGSRKEATRG